MALVACQLWLRMVQDRNLPLAPCGLSTLCRDKKYGSCQSTTYDVLHAYIFVQKEEKRDGNFY